MIPHVVVYNGELNFITRIVNEMATFVPQSSLLLGRLDLKEDLELHIVF